MEETGASGDTPGSTIGVSGSTATTVKLNQEGDPLYHLSDAASGVTARPSAIAATTTALIMLCTTVS